MKLNLNAKTAGLSRKLWVILLVGAVAVGLFLRHRAAAKAQEATPYDGSLSGADLSSQSDPGLAGAALAGPAAGAIPVETPTGPQGRTDIITGQQGLLADYATRDNAVNAVDNSGPTAAPPINITLTGGGPPKARPGSHRSNRTKTPAQKVQTISHKYGAK